MQAIILLVKYFKCEKVKTRLAKTIGSEAATEIYRLSTEHVTNELRNLPDSIRKYIFVSNKSDMDNVQNWIGDDYILRPQHGYDFGDMMFNAFTKVFEEGATSALILASDTPNLNSEIIKDAFDIMNSRDATIGPADDGGYYLLGIKKTFRPLFYDIEWSTSSVGETTCNRLKDLGLTYAEVAKLPDMDYESDLRGWIDSGFAKNNPLKEKFCEILKRNDPC